MFSSDILIVILVGCANIASIQNFFFLTRKYILLGVILK